MNTFRSEAEKIPVICDACGAGSYIESHPEALDALTALVLRYVPEKASPSNLPVDQIAVACRNEVIDEFKTNLQDREE